MTTQVCSWCLPNRWNGNGPPDELNGKYPSSPSMMRSRRGGRLAHWPALFMALPNRATDQIDRGEEPDFPTVVLDCLNTEGRCDVRLARARTACQEDVVGAIGESVVVQPADQGLIRLAGCKVASGQILASREAGGPPIF